MNGGQGENTCDPVRTMTYTKTRKQTYVTYVLSYGLLSKGTDTSYHDVMGRWTAGRTDGRKGEGDLFARSDETRTGSDEHNVT